MTDPKDKSSPPPDMPFDEALARFIQTDPRELADAMERVRRGQAEVEKRAHEIREKIQAGVRRPGRKLRL